MDDIYQKMNETAQPQRSQLPETPPESFCKYIFGVFLSQSNIVRIRWLCGLWETGGVSRNGGLQYLSQ